MTYTNLLIATFVLLTATPQTTLAAASTACGSSGWKSGTYTMQHGGLTRTFRVHVPRDHRYDLPSPLITWFHGWGGNENEILEDEEVISQADSHGYIIVAPRGIGSGEPDHGNNSWSFSGSTTGLDGDGGAICDPGVTPDYSYASCAGVKANTCSWTQCQADDVSFATALVDTVVKNLCVDTSRVFASGGSNGGMLAWELGQNPASASTFRAIAPVIGLPHRGYLSTQGKTTDLPVLVITGTQDNVVPPGDWEDPSFTTTSNGNDRFYYTGATAITRRWAAAHDCDVSGHAVSFDDGNAETDCRSYCFDDPGWPRVLDCRADMGHGYGLSFAWKLIMDFFDNISN